MKRDKKLQMLVEKDLKQLQNNNLEQQILEEHKIAVASNNYAESKKSKLLTNKLKFAISSVACALVIIVISISLVLIHFSSPNEQIEEKHYAYEDIISQPISSEEINNELQIISLNSKYIVNAFRAVDSVSGDLLFYSVEWENEEAFISCRIDFVVNSDFKYISKETTSATNISGIEYKVYGRMQHLEEDGIFIHTIYAQSNISNIKIYINEYEEWTISENNNFHNFIEGAVIIKNN